MPWFRIWSPDLRLPLVQVARASRLNAVLRQVSSSGSISFCSQSRAIRFQSGWEEASM